MLASAVLHFGERLTDVGAVEGPWWNDEPVQVGDDQSTPDALRLRLPDGTLAYVAGHCKQNASFTRVTHRFEYGIDAWLFDRYLRWADDGQPMIVAFHEHDDDVLRWQYVLELGAVARSADVGGDAVWFLPVDAFHTRHCAVARA